MFIAFQVIAILGIFAGALIFFYGMALFNAYISQAKSIKSCEPSKDNESAEIEGEDNENDEENNSDIIASQCEENSTDDAESVEKRKKLFTPLPGFLLIEGVILFIFNALMFILKFYYPKMMEFYVLLPVNVGYILLSFFINGIAMMGKSEGENEINVDNTIDKTEEK